jgi:hypothetical protein
MTATSHGSARVAPTQLTPDIRTTAVPADTAMNTTCTPFRRMLSTAAGATVTWSSADRDPVLEIPSAAEDPAGIGTGRNFPLRLTATP